MHEPNWSDYYAATASRPLHPLYLELQRFFSPPGQALDLGCGVGTGTLWLAEQGFDVHAVDREKEAIEKLIERKPCFACISTELADFACLELEPDSFDVVTAQFSLFFMPRADFDQFWPRLTDSIRCNGLFMGTFLGINDTWANQYTTHMLGDIEDLLYDFSIEYHEEAERDGLTALGDSKHWHVHHVIARKN